MEGGKRAAKLPRAPPLCHGHCAVRPMPPLSVSSVPHQSRAARGASPSSETLSARAGIALMRTLPLLVRCRLPSFLKKYPAPPFSVSEVRSCSTSRVGGGASPISPPPALPFKQSKATKHPPSPYPPKLAAGALTWCTRRKWRGVILFHVSPVSVSLLHSSTRVGISEPGDKGETRP